MLSDEVMELADLVWLRFFANNLEVELLVGEDVMTPANSDYPKATSFGKVGMPTTMYWT